MRSIRPNALILLSLGLLFGLSSGASAQLVVTEAGVGGCFVNLGVTECAKATFSLMNGTTVLTGTSASNVTGLQIVIQNTTPTSVTTYANADLLTGFFWGINGNPALATTTTTTTTNKKTTTTTTINGSALATNSMGGNAILDPTQCTTVGVCTGASIDVGAYWAGTYKVGGWTGTPGTFAGSYVVTTSGYGLLGVGQGTNIGANDPSLISNGNSSLNMGIVGSAGITPTRTPTGKPSIQDTVTIQVAFASPLGLNLNTDLILADVFFAYGTNPDSSSGAKKVPEPASLALFGVGVAALGWVRRRKRHQHSV